MDARTAYQQRLFSLLWKHAQDTGFYRKEVRLWLRTEAFPLILGPGHCFRCHGFEDGYCTHEGATDRHICSGCVKAEREHKLAVQAVLRDLIPERPVMETLEPPSAKDKPMPWLEHLAQPLAELFDQTAGPPVVEPCGHCGCARQHHHVRVGDEATGCANHLGCDGWRPEIDPRRYDCYAPDDCMGPPCGCPTGAHE